jgi:hypothetical protein
MIIDTAEPMADSLRPTANCHGGNEGHFPYFRAMSRRGTAAFQIADCGLQIGEDGGEGNRTSCLHSSLRRTSFGAVGPWPSLTHRRAKRNDKKEGRKCSRNSVEKGDR